MSKNETANASFDKTFAIRGCAGCEKQGPAHGETNVTGVMSCAFLVWQAKVAMGQERPGLKGNAGLTMVMPSGKSMATLAWNPLPFCIGSGSIALNLLHPVLPRFGRVGGESQALGGKGAGAGNHAPCGNFRDSLDRHPSWKHPGTRRSSCCSLVERW